MTCLCIAISDTFGVLLKWHSVEIIELSLQLVIVPILLRVAVGPQPCVCCNRGEHRARIKAGFALGFALHSVLKNTET
jgi:hypothetical protein